MFQKYIGKLGNYEAECVQEILDMVDGDVHKGQALALKAYDELAEFDRLSCEQAEAQEHNSRWLVLLRIKSKVPVPTVRPLSALTQAVAAISFASPRWWWDGIEKLGLRHAYFPVKE